MIIKLFGVIGLVLAWVVHVLATGPIVFLALVVLLIRPLISEERLYAIVERGWPDKYEAFISKITGVKV